MNAFDRNYYKIGMRVRVSRLLIGLMSLALVLSVQFMVVAGVAEDPSVTNIQLDNSFRELSATEMGLKIVMVVLLVCGLGLVTLGAESIIDKLPTFKTSKEKTNDQSSGHTKERNDSWYQTYKPHKTNTNKNSTRHIKPLPVH